MYSVTFQRVTANAAGDLYSGKLVVPARFLMLASVGPFEANAEDSLAVHFRVLGKTYTSPALTSNVQGTEPWFPFSVNYIGTVSFRGGSYLLFRTGAEIQEFWLDVGGEGAAAPVNGVYGSYTFIYSNDVDAFVIPSRGQWAS